MGLHENCRPERMPSLPPSQPPGVAAPRAVQHIPSLVLRAAAAIFLFGAATLWAGAGSEAVSEPHPIGLITSDDGHARIVIRDMQCRIDQPVVPGEQVVLSTVGAEHQVDGRTEFHPLISVLVDRTFPESVDGEWLALWNLGHKSPSFWNRLRAALPGFTASKSAPKGDIRKLNQRLDNFEQLYEQGRIDLPKPAYHINKGFRPANKNLVLVGVKQALGWADVSFLGQFLFRGYLLRRDDAMRRQFQQSYLGLTWYEDVATVTPYREALSPADLEDIKFRLLANRHPLGSFVKEEAADDFIQGYEIEWRDHLWGTSCFLASAANEEHLGYEELRRYTAGGVPMAVGGVLYYDPQLAPAPELERWPAANPFDLTYNPFQHPAVLEAAKSGRKVPLALYAYQSNLALKPIIMVDFFDADNPRLRESASYWRKLGNEALGATNVGFLYKTLAKAFSFSMNRKEYTWLTDNKYSLGVEEMRFSLMSHMYFQEKAGDELLDRIDRMMVNPLTQPGRLQRLRAELQYEALRADEGREVVQLARRLREKHMRHVLKNKGPLTETAYSDYRRHLRIRQDLRDLEIYLKDPYSASLQADTLAQAVRSLASEAVVQDRKAVETLFRFHLEISNRKGLRDEAPPDAHRLASLTEQTLRQIYRSSNLGEEDLQAGFEEAARKEEKRRIDEENRQENSLAKYFQQQMDLQIETLETLVEKQGDLTKVSPWHVNWAIEFFRDAPQVIAQHPKAAKKFQKKEEKVRLLLAQAEQAMAKPQPGVQVAWLEEQRELCLAALHGTRTELRAALWPHEPAPSDPASQTRAAVESGTHEDH